MAWVTMSSSSLIIRFEVPLRRRWAGNFTLAVIAELGFKVRSRWSAVEAMMMMVMCHAMVIVPPPS